MPVAVWLRSSPVQLYVNVLINFSINFGQRRNVWVYIEDADSIAIISLCKCACLLCLFLLVFFIFLSFDAFCLNGLPCKRWIKYVQDQRWNTDRALWNRAVAMCLGCDVNSCFFSLRLFQFCYFPAVLTFRIIAFCFLFGRYNCYWLLATASGE